MILSVPYTYEVVGYEPRRTSNATSFRRRGVVDVMVEEIDPREAPVAAVWTRSEAWERKGETRTPIVIRRAERGLYCTWSQSGHNPENAPEAVRVPDLRALVAGGDDHEENPFAFWNRQAGEVKEQEPRLRAVVRDGREEAEREIRERAEGLVLIDGMFHVPCPEPVLVLKGGFRNLLNGLKLQWGKDYVYSEVDPEDVFRVTEWDVLLGRAAAKAVILGEEMDLPAELPWIDVRLPDAFALPTEGIHVTHAAMWLFKEMGDVLQDSTRRAAERVHRGRDNPRNPMEWTQPFDVAMPDPDLVEAWMALGTFLNEGVSSDRIGELRALMDRYATDLRGPDPRDEDWRRSGYRDVREKWGELRAALARYDARPEHLRTDDLADLAELMP